MVIKSCEHGVRMQLCEMRGRENGTRASFELCNANSKQIVDLAGLMECDLVDHEPSSCVVLRGAPDC